MSLAPLPPRMKEKEDKKKNSKKYGTNEYKSREAQCKHFILKIYFRGSLLLENSLYLGKGVRTKRKLCSRTGMIRAQLILTSFGLKFS